MQSPEVMAGQGSDQTSDCSLHTQQAAAMQTVLLNLTSPDKFCPCWSMTWNILCPELCLLISSQSKSHLSNLSPSSLYNTPHLPAPTLCLFYILLPYFPSSSHSYPGLLLVASLLAPLSIVWPLPEWELQEIRAWPGGFSVIRTNCLPWTCWYSVNIFK